MPLKVAAFLVFTALVAGATWGVSNVLGDETAVTQLTSKLARETLNGTAGSTLGYSVTLTNRGSEPLTVTARLEGAGASGTSAPVVTPAGRSTVAFVPVMLSADATPGTVSLDLTLTNSLGQVLRYRPAAATLVVLEPTSVGFAAGDAASVLYAGRIADSGLVFNTNDPALLDQPFARTEFYRPSNGALSVTTVPRVSVVTGFYEGMLGMQPGESRTITFPPEKGYGPALEESREDREERLEAVFTLELNDETVDRATFDGYVLETGQGNETSFQAGDTFVFYQGPNAWPYRIVNITESNVDYRLHTTEGALHTLYPFWANASRVESVNDTHVVFRTTPTTSIGDPFTMRSHWPDMTAVVDVTDTEIVVRHSPTVGLKYSLSGGLAAPRDYTVKEVTDTTIVTTTLSTNPLAGKTLTFDVTMLSLTK